MNKWSTTVDFIIRSCVTAALTIYITWGVLHFALNGATPPSWLLTTAAASWAFYFGNHFVQNGKMLDAVKIMNALQSSIDANKAVVEAVVQTAGVPANEGVNEGETN